MKHIDQIYSYDLPGQVFGNWQIQFRLRIYFPHPEQQTVIISDASSTTGWFIPYKVEYLANLIVKQFRLNPDLVVWIEHYSKNVRKPTCAEFSHVQFNWQDGIATAPAWSPLAPEIVTIMTGETLQLSAKKWHHWL